MTDIDPNCEFCKIARNDGDSAQVVADGASWIAFFPREPATPGHTMIIPRSHVTDLWELDTDLGSDLMTAVIEVGKAIGKALNPDGMNLISSAGAAAEQSVFHLHLHVVPRWSSDGIDQIWPPREPMNITLREGLAEQIRSAL